MSDSERNKAADALNRQGEEPEAESGAGYGSHAPIDETASEDGTPEEESA